MFRVLTAVIVMCALSACAQTPQWSWSKGFANLDFAPRAQAFSFDWELSGDPQIAPLQVFDDGRRTWLQFAADQVPPAVFRRTERGDVLLKASRDGAYQVIDGVWPHVLVRGGHLVAHVRRAARAVQSSASPNESPSSKDGAAQDVAVAQTTPLVLSVPQIEPVSRGAGEPESASASASELRPESAPEPVMEQEHEPILLTPPAMPESEPRMEKDISEFAVSPDDGNLRLALVRWAAVAGWTFGPEHWAVDVDIPLTGAAQFGAAFQPAVRHLLAATELGDRPLQPCFYANQVLRIVPFAQRCDRSLAPGAV